MRIMVCNDDGISAHGIIALARALCQIGEVYVVAPDRERSAASHSLTITSPLRAKEVSFPVLVAKAYAVDGTPVDCAKLGLFHLLPAMPDIVVSGINRGGNMCVDVFYSGTVAGAFEGAFQGVPSFAVSLADTRHDADFAPAAKVAVKCVRSVLQEGPQPGVVYNINVPPIPYDEILGIRVTRLGKLGYGELYDQRSDPGGRAYYWLKGTPEVLDHSSDSDIVTVNEGYVSITPLMAELTDFNQLEHTQNCMKHFSLNINDPKEDNGTT